MRNGPVVLIVSDGWDRGDPDVLSRELARVRRSCRRLIWLNPLLGSPRYEPLTRGMQAGLRHVDDFLPAHNIASLEQLADHLRALRARTHGQGDGQGRWAMGRGLRVEVIWVPSDELRTTNHDHDSVYGADRNLRIQRPCATVWDLLMNTDAVGGCLPGSRGLQAVGDDRYEVDLGVAVAAISGNFKGTVAIRRKSRHSPTRSRSRAAAGPDSSRVPHV